MDKTETKARRRWFWALLGLPPALCLVLIGALVCLSQLAPSVLAGDIDIRVPLGTGPASPTFRVAATTSAGPGKRQITIGLGMSGNGQTPPTAPAPVRANPSPAGTWAEPTTDDAADPGQD